MKRKLNTIGRWLGLSLLVFTGACSRFCTTCTSGITIDPGKAVIVASAKEKLAAEELQTNLKAISGLTVPILDKTVADRYVFRFEPAVLEGNDEACAWQVTEKETVFRGKADFAVYDFLETALGVRWPEGDFISCKAANPIVVSQFSGSWKPELKIRNVRGNGGPTGMHRRRMRAGQHDAPLYGHAFTDHWKKYGRTHREYFGMRNDGVRAPYGVKPEDLLDNVAVYEARVVNQLAMCCTSTGLVEQIVKDWIAAGKGEYINLCENDVVGQHSCQCEACKALDVRPANVNPNWETHYADRYVYFGNKVLAAARKHRPDVKVSYYAYNATQDAPSRQRPEAASVIGIVPTYFTHKYVADYVTSWKKMGAKHFFYRPNRHHYYVCSFLPIGSEEHFYEILQYLISQGTIGFDYDARLAEVGGFEWMERYILLHAMQDPSKPYSYWEDHYCQGYGAAKDDVKAYYRYWREEVWNKRLEPNLDTIVQKGRCFNFGRGLVQNLKDYYRGEDFAAAEAFLRAAEAKAGLSPLEKATLARLRVAHDHARLFFEAVTRKTKEATAALVAYRKAHGYPLMPWSEQYFGDVAGIKAFLEPKGANVTLVENGVAKCRVVVPDNASKAVRFAADELTKYIQRATGCKDLRGEYPIRLVVAPQTKGLKEDGFRITTTTDTFEGLTIAGYNEAGVLYGAYEILKKYAGMRWVTPGDDGEYCVHQGKDLRVPVGTDLQNPNLKVRVTVGCDSPEGILWHLRNNMDAPIIKFFEKGVKTSGPCGHILSNLLNGGDKDFFSKHPEYYPLIDGKRIPIKGANDPNPCISNPKVLDRLAENFLKAMGEKQETHDYLTIGNNDTTVWCQCEKCRALDPPEMKNTRGELSDRYWYMVSEIAKRVWAKRPDAKLGGWAYQNFWYAPVRIKPDPRLRVLISFNNQCWRHTCCDADCPVNKEMVKIYEGWKKLNMPIVMNRDEIGAWDGGGAPGCELIPAERILCTNIREDYPRLGCNGSNFCVPGPFPRFSGFAKNWSPYYGNRYHWYAMWQTCYMSAKFMWNAQTPFESTLEEANRLFYGAGWDAGMKDFRALLTDCFFGAPGCIGWGQGTTTGRCLDKAGSEEKLVAYLDKALAAAKAAKDARAVEHIDREKKIFEMTWLRQRKLYVESYREMTAYKVTGPITVDGVLDEKDWQTADSYSNFQPPEWERKNPACDPQKTYLKVAYDRDHLYFAVEAMEPHPEKMIAGDKVDRFAEGCGTLGNHLELFYSYPDMNQAAWHMMINSKGQIIDALQKSATVRDLSIVTKAKWAVKVSSDRWTLEMAIPCSEIGQNILDGMTWKINCARQREVEGVRRSASTAANGSFHGTANFVNVKFLAKRSGTGARDVSSWKNGDFNSVIEIAKQHRPERFKMWTSKIMPTEWSLDTGSLASCQPKADNAKDYYVTVRKGQLNQYYFPQAKGKVKVTVRVRGKGKVGFLLLNYVDYAKGEGRGGYKSLDNPKPQQPSFELTEDWKTVTLEREVNGLPTERMCVRMFPVGKDSVLDVDDCLVYPVE